ncbi:competence/damage-inducible protein A [Limosilactobacillus secaliphilus]|uniref:Putative competence-damage inducible protein n=1 Tax=Limosilactobacillus secaliphilus TaxID=396268 RepID=A0A0R2I702_9LACO|nr:competence/damage-inducible protein A [Limosilactobacillus secaliphilus]KRN59414.1 competence damage-inducible protein A [Limosilactobacillus secaliphilus]
MEAEIIAVGTEITLGQIVNSNARFLADQLRRLGIESHWQVTVDDDPARISEAIHNAWLRNQLLFVCGGLGPTDDDRTLQSTADALGVDLAVDEDQWQAIQADFKRRQAKMVPENKRQAYFLNGGMPLANPVGLAVGSFWQGKDHTVVVLPGPPREFKAMVSESLLPKLKNLMGKPIISRNLHFVGCPESELMDRIQAVLPDKRVVATSYVQPDEIQVRLTVHNETTTNADELLNTAQEKILQAVGDYYFGTGEEVSLAKQVVDCLKKKHLHISAAESLTGGLFQATICSVPGASNVFDGGLVTYAIKVKESLLGVPKEVIDQQGVVSAATAEAMASHVQKLLHADIGVGFTGVAGPDSLEGHPAGTVWIGIAFPDHVESFELHLSGKLGRQNIRRQSVQRALLRIYHGLK